VPFESVGAVTYSCSIVTIAVSVAVCEIFGVKNGVTLKTGLRFVQDHLEMGPFDRSHTSSYKRMALSCIVCEI